MFLNTRTINLSGVLLVLVALGVGYYIQHGLGVRPCLLCQIQRTCMIMVGVMFFASLIHQNSHAWAKRYTTLGIVVLTVGLLAVWRQLYLQSLPPSESALCLPGATFFLHKGEYVEAIKSLFSGTSDCGKVAWTFLGLSLAAWSGVILGGLFGLSVVSLMQSSRRHS